MADLKNRQGFSTRAIHAGQRPDPTTGAVMMPIYATSTYVQESPGVHKGYEYSRSQNPTRQALEACIADLENGAHGLAFASGLASMGTVLELLDSGDHVIAMDDLYGGSYRLFENVRKRSAALEFSFVDLADPAKFEAAITPKTRMVWVESPTNPLLKLAGPVSHQPHRQGARHPDGLRQYLRHPLLPATAGFRRRHRGAFHHQVSERPYGCAWWRRRHRRQPGPAGAAVLPADCSGHASSARSTASSPCGA